jgi:TorA maturation chaperone TorD
LDKKTRVYIYAFLSRIFSEQVDKKLLSDLKTDDALLKTIGEETFVYIQAKDEETLLDELNIEYHSLFVMNNHPIESSVQDVKNEILVGLQNPVMQFYFQHGYEVNMDASKLYVPDHLGMELGFMQNLILQDEKQAQLQFYKVHLLSWVPQFLIAIKEMSVNPFYRDICDFCIDFMLEDFSNLSFEMEHKVDI